MSGQPPLRRAFDWTERKVGEPLEKVAGSNRFVQLAVLNLRVQKTLNQGARRLVHRQITMALHLLNVPTYGDVRRLSSQLATLTNEVRSLSLTPQLEAQKPLVIDADSEPRNRDA